jgi:holo-[acyl-carrier protein] synthase
VIVGVGVDVVDIERLGAALERTPGLAARLFTTAELECEGTASLAVRFAAKEAAAKALGVPTGSGWHDAEVVREASGRPVLRVVGALAGHAEAQGVRSWHVSLSHDGGIATAFVVAES